MTDCVVPSVEVEGVEDGAYDSDDSIIQAPWLLSYVKDTGRIDDKKEIENCLPFEAYCETELRGNTSSTDECDEMYENIGAMPQTELDTEDSEPAGNYPILKNPISSPEVTVSQSSNPFSSKRDRTPRTLRKMMERHRENERVRHRSLNEALKVLCKKVPGFRESDKDTKVAMMQYVVDYVTFLHATVMDLCSDMGLTQDLSNLITGRSTRRKKVSDPVDAISLSQALMMSGLPVLNTGDIAVKTNKSYRSHINKPFTIARRSRRGRRKKISSPTIDSTTSDCPESHNFSSTDSASDCGYPDSSTPAKSSMGCINISVDNIPLSPEIAWDCDQLEYYRKRHFVPVLNSPQSINSPGNVKRSYSAGFDDESNSSTTSTNMEDPLDAWTSHNDPMSPRIIVNDVSLDDEPDADLQGICSPNSVLPQDGSKPQLYTAVISDSQTAIYDSPTRHLPYAPRVKKLQFSPNDTASIPDRVSLQDGNEILCYTEKQGRARPRKSKTPIKRLRVPPMSGPVKMERVLGVKKDTMKQQAVGQPCQREVEQQCDEGHGRFLYKQASDMYVSYVPYVNKLHNKAVTKRQRAKVAKGLATEKMPSEIKKRNEAMSPACTRPKVDNRRTSWMNGFMMFSQLNRRKFIRANPGVHTSHISKMMGHTWRTMTTQDKQPFRDQAKRYIEIMRKPGTELYDSCDGLSPDLFQRSDSRCSTTSSIFTDSSDSYTSVLSDSTTNILSQY